jgi:hypothetical protein
MIDFIRALIVGALFWAAIAAAWWAGADELPPIPNGHTLTTNEGLAECYPTDEFRKIVLWVETAKALHTQNADLLELTDSTRAELVVVSQELAIRSTQLVGNEAEVIRLRALIDLQAAEYAKFQRTKTMRAWLTWSAVGLLAGGMLSLGIAYGVKR